jgi:Fe2+ or Zn2+ uptake regulation protein
MDKCNANNILKKNKLKSTRQRILLLEAIINSEKVFSANSLHERIKNRMDLVTIYRILSILLEKKIIREIVSNETTKFYELSCEHNPVHPHFICDKCKNIICLGEIDRKEIANLEKYSEDNLIKTIIIQFTGTCNKCK